MTSTSNGTASKTEYSYDSEGRVVEIVTGTGASADALEPESKVVYAYDTIVKEFRTLTEGYSWNGSEWELYALEFYDITRDGKDRVSNSTDKRTTTYKAYPNGGFDHTFYQEEKSKYYEQTTENIHSVRYDEYGILTLDKKTVEYDGEGASVSNLATVRWSLPLFSAIPARNLQDVWPNQSLPTLI